MHIPSHTLKCSNTQISASESFLFPDPCLRNDKNLLVVVTVTGNSINMYTLRYFCMHIYNIDICINKYDIDILMIHTCTYSHHAGNPAAPLHQPTPYELSSTGSERSAGGVRFRPILPRPSFCWKGTGVSILPTQTSLKMTLHLHCFIPPK